MFSREKVSKGRMNSFAVVKAFDEFKGFLGGLFPDAPIPPIRFPFDYGKEGLRRGIVITIAPAWHACLDAMFCKLLPIFPAPVLASLIRMTNQCFWATPIFQSFP